MNGGSEMMTTTDNEIPKTVTIGKDLIVDRIGFGTMQLVGPKEWGEYPYHDKGIALLKEVVDQDVTFIDTADVYGPHSNEELIHEALHPYPDKLVIATKGGFVRGGPDYADMGAVGNRAYLKQSAYMSMRRLGLDHIDLYYLHTPTMTDVPFEEMIDTLAEMREIGLIRNIGLSNISAEQLQTALEITEIAAVTAHYSIGVRIGAALLKVSDEAGVVFSPWHPAAVPSGEDGTRFHSVLDPLAETHRVSAQQIALAWQLHRSPLMLPIPGTTGVDHLRENLAAVNIALTQSEVDMITDLEEE
jgi:aryl-alcohol dehydrogenase-like predicted oxidoreductase